MTSFLTDLQKRFDPKHVGIVEFAESDEYCGKPLYPLQRVLLKLIFLEEMEGWEEDILTWWINGGRGSEIILSPDIRKRRDICRDRGYHHFSEVDLVGGRRSSKGYITGLAAAYKLWMTREIPDPAAFFGMDIDKQIEITAIAASFDQSKTRQFADFYSSVSRCKALQPYVSKRLETEITVRADTDIAFINQMKRDKIKVARDQAKFRIVPLAANADTLRGSASIFTVFDEMAFMMPGESRSSAQECYTAAEPSLTQFGHYAMVFCNSSPYSRIGQFYEQFELAMRGPNSSEEWYPHRFAFQFPSWALYDKWWIGPKPARRPIMVSPDWADQLDEQVEESKLDAQSQGMRDNEKLKEKANPDTYKVEYRAMWAEVLDAYLNPDKVDMAYSGIKPNGELCQMSNGGTYVLAPYMGHCDPSSTTAGFGFALGHVEEFEDPSGIFPGGMSRHVVFDRVHRWNPEDFGGVINYIIVREELTQVIDLYRPQVITFDQYNSTGLMQELRAEIQKMRITETRVHEITATAAVNWNRWEAFKTALYLGLVHIPPNCLTYKDTPREFNHSEYSKQELKFLQLVQTGQTFRVDKQDLGPIQTKDIADCIAEVTVKFLSSYLGDIMSKNLSNTHVTSGAEGGYQIGGRNPGGPMDMATRGSMGAGRFNEFYGGVSQWIGKGGPNASRGINPFRRRR